jgi:cytidylate kinase
VTDKNQKTVVNIAIDGPAGAGKSTLSKMLAARLGFLYIDTGALYRAVGLAALRQGASAPDEKSVRGLLAGTAIEIRFQDGGQHVYVNGEDVSAEIRSPEVAMAASAFSALPQVRAFLLDLQKNMAARNNVVMDGRDIGTVVLPDADVKIFLTASAEDRANRRYLEMIERGEQADYSRVLEDIKKRDAADIERDIAPLRQAADAVLIDTTGFALEKSLETLAALVEARLPLE